MLIRSITTEMFYPKNSMMMPRSTIHKQKRKKFHLSSVLLYLSPFPLTFPKTILRCRGGMKRSNSFRPTWKRQQRPTILSILLRR